MHIKQNRWQWRCHVVYATILYCKIKYKIRSMKQSTKCTKDCGPCKRTHNCIRTYTCMHMCTVFWIPACIHTKHRPKQLFLMFVPYFFLNFYILRIEVTNETCQKILYQYFWLWRPQSLTYTKVFNSTLKHSKQTLTFINTNYSSPLHGEWVKYRESKKNSWQEMSS